VTNATLLIVGVEPYTHLNFVLEYLFDLHYVPDFYNVQTIFYRDNSNWLGLIVKGGSIIMDSVLDLDMKHVSRESDQVIAV